MDTYCNTEGFQSAVNFFCAFLEDPVVPLARKIAFLPLLGVLLVPESRHSTEVGLALREFVRTQLPIRSREYASGGSPGL